MLFILTGSIQSGKTRWLESLLEEVRRLGVLPFGVVAPGVWKRGHPNEGNTDENGFEKLGINNTLLPQEHTLLFAKRRDIAKEQGEIDSASQSERASLGWYMSNDAIDKVNSHFEAALRAGVLSYAQTCEAAKLAMHEVAHEAAHATAAPAPHATHDVTTPAPHEAARATAKPTPHEATQATQAFLVVDELGRLELLRDTGLTSAMQLLRQGCQPGCENALVVVRDALCQIACDMLGDVWGQSTLIHPDEEGARRVLSSLKSHDENKPKTERHEEKRHEENKSKTNCQEKIRHQPKQGRAAMNKQDIQNIIDALEQGKTPELTPQMVPAFSEDSLRGNKNVTPEYLSTIAKSLSAKDIPTLRRAASAIDNEELAWLGFKVVYDEKLAVLNKDNEVTKKYGEVGSADGEPLVFFCNDAKEIVASRAYSDRDKFQMKDVTRGPSMHNEQFEGLTWMSCPLFERVRVWLLGASDVACELAPMALHVGFSVSVADYDPAYLNEDRFPGVDRILLGKGNFDDLQNYHASEKDYVCVLTRGHMFDPQGCLWAVRHGVHYTGLMGCAGKNNTVYELVRAQGLSDAQWANIKRPIGIKFGAKTPAELAISIVAELIDVRYKQRYSLSAQLAHEASLGRA